MPILGPIKFVPKVSANVSQNFHTCVALSNIDSVSNFDVDDWDEDNLGSVGVAANTLHIKIKMD